MIRVVIAEDHEMVRAGLEELLASAGDIEVVGTAGNGERAVELVNETEPDVVLCDLSMPRMDGPTAMRRMLKARPETRVVVLTAFSERTRILGAIDAGAAGYLLKDAPPDELFGAVRAAARGEAPLAPKAAEAVLAERAEQRTADLSDREREVLAALAEGLPNKLIARRLEISEKTVKAHLTRIYERIGVTDRTQAVLWAQRNGMVGEPPQGRPPE